MVTAFNPDGICSLTAFEWERVGSRLEQSELDWIVECMCRGSFNLEDRAAALAEKVEALIRRELVKPFAEVFDVPQSYELAEDGDAEA